MQGLIRKPMPLYVRFEDYNNHNEHEYDPYIIRDDGVLLIDKTWWDSLTHVMKSQIKNTVDNFELVENIIVPHELCAANPILTAVYRAYLEGFDYQHWYSSEIPNGPKNVTLIHLSSEEKKHLCDKNIEPLTAFKQKLQVCCTGNEYFVRLSGTSGKNEKPVRPFKSADDIIHHLTRVDLFRTREYERNKETFLVLIPWNNAIDPRCEFRIFVVNNKLTAASPQRYWEHHQHSTEELEAFETALNNIEFIGKVPYHTFVADVYVNIDTATCHLIELNPFGAHSGAGASFFNWIDDYNVLYGLENSNPQLRYLSAINY